ncbi:RDD family protein [Kitasatospora sp. NPDC048540]|uniref:RDD family protein n=1 Tax=unclassified Kitasatospora TaxID=2633591 RepID=UPI00053ACAEE|nr:RDD family protein [Kitasatospora sp. MBT63]
MSYPPDPNNPYGQQPPPPPGYGYPQQAPPPAPGYGYPQQAPPPQQQGYGIPPQQGYAYPTGPYSNAGTVQNFYAGWGSRVVAYLIDHIVVGLIPWIVVFVALKPSVTTTYSASGYPHTETTGMGGYYAGILLANVLVWAGIAAMKATGQSLGQKAVSIRMVRESDGQKLSFGAAFGREALHILDSFCCIGLLWPLWDAKKQTFADKIMSTVVVKAQ